MERFFNTAGPLHSAKHYVLDPLLRWNLPEALTLIDREKYFLLHAPRQKCRGWAGGSQRY